MATIIIRLKDTTFQDLITLGRTYLLDGFIDGLKEEIEKGNSIVIDKYENIIDVTFPLEIKTFQQLVEFENTYL